MRMMITLRSHYYVKAQLNAAIRTDDFVVLQSINRMNLIVFQNDNNVGTLTLIVG